MLKNYLFKKNLRKVIVYKSYKVTFRILVRLIMTLAFLTYIINSIYIKLCIFFRNIIFKPTIINSFLLSLLLVSSIFYVSALFRLWHMIIYLFIIYFIVNIWFYFYNIYKYSKYTTNVSRFWKRTYMLFWLVEFFLFSIYIYIYIICPSEVYYMHSYCNNTVSLWFNNYDNFIYINIVLICSLSNIIIFLKKYNNTIMFTVWLLIFYMYSYIVFIEFFKFIDCIYILSNNSIGNYNKLYLDIGYFSSDITLYKDLEDFDISNYRTSTYVNIILVILKFWHIIFIYIIFLLLTITFVKFKFITNNGLSINLQNSIYLFIFSSLNYLYMLVELLKFFFDVSFSTNFVYCYSDLIINEFSFCFMFI